MSCLGVILGCDGMSTPQNGVAAYSQSHVSCICQGGFPLPSLRFRLPGCHSPMVGPPKLQRLSSDLTVFSQQPASDADSHVYIHYKIPHAIKVKMQKLHMQ